MNLKCQDSHYIRDLYQLDLFYIQSAEDICTQTSRLTIMLASNVKL